MDYRTLKVDTLTDLVSAFCRDYDRRAAAVKQNKGSKRVLTELRFINYKVLEAAREIAGVDAEIYIREIGKKKGFASSDIARLSEVAYKLKKAEIVANIAKHLYLTD